MRFVCQVPSDLNFLHSRDDCFAALLKSSSSLRRAADFSRLIVFRSRGTRDPTLLARSFHL